MIRLLLLLGLPVLAAAQTLGPRMTAPSLGYIFDENAKSIRRISGIPGAAGLDLPVTTGSLDSAFVQSRTHLAIANTKEGRIGLVDWNTDPRVTVLDSNLAKVTIASFSRLGDRVAISDGRAVEIWSGLPGSPSKTSSLANDDGFSSLALGTDGTLAAVTQTGVLLLAGSEPRIIARGIGAVAFFANGEDLAAVDSAAHNLLVIRGFRTSPASNVAASLDQDATALGISADGTSVALSMAGSNADIRIVKLADGVSRNLGCNCQATSFDSLEGDFVFRAANQQTGSPLVIDANAQDSAVSPIPSIGGSAQ